MVGVLLSKAFTLVVKPFPTGRFSKLAASVLPLNIHIVLPARVQELASELCVLFQVMRMG